MNIVDALIIICLIVGILAGFRRGLIKEVVLLLGLILTIVISFSFKDVISTFLYKNLPFFSFGGIFSGVKVLNILLYEVIAFLIVFSIVYLILRIILKITGIIEKILRATIILGFFSRIGGAIVGFIEGYIIVFIALFILSQPFINIKEVRNSKYTNKILSSTPVMSKSIDKSKKVIDEVYSLAKDYKDETFNERAINLFIKYDIISEENINILKEKGKL